MIIQKLEKQMSDKPNLQCSVGDTVKMGLRIKEGEKERLQYFQGLVIKIQGRSQNRALTVRKVSGGVGVERTVPLSSPYLDSLTIISSAKIRRSRLHFMRGLKGRASRLKSENRY